MSGTAAMNSDTRLLEIRAHQGSQQGAWEELTYQLRPTEAAVR